MNIRLDLEYDGSRFHGFAIQPGLCTVQGEIERILAQLFQRQIRIIGAGRTDAGVHALGQVVNFPIDRTVDLPLLLHKLNRMSPVGLAGTALREVPDAFNARYSALRRIYRYRLSLRKQGLGYPDCAWLPFALDGALLSAAARVFIGRHNFRNFCVDEGERGYECEIFRLEAAAEKDGWVFTVEANRYLQRMVRMMTGAMVDVARGLWPMEKISELLEGPLVIQKATALPPQGLCLMKVIYPEEG